MNVHALQNEIYGRLKERYGDPKYVNDIEVGSRLITQIAIESFSAASVPSDPVTHEKPLTLKKGDSVSSSRVVFHQTLGSPLAEKTEPSATSILAQYQKRFEHLLEANFPFAEAPEALCREALTIVTSHRSSIDAAFILTALFKVRIENPEFIPGSSEWREMQFLVNILNIALLGQALEQNYENATTQNHPSATSIFLTLFRMIFHQHDHLPPFSDVPLTTLDSWLKESLAELNFFDTFSSINDQTRIIELMLFRSSRFDPIRLLQFVNVPLFFRFVLNRLRMIPFEAWPQKDVVILTCLEIFIKESKQMLALELAASEDPKSQNVGLVLYDALSAVTLPKMYLHIYQLLELLPRMNDSEVHHIFHISMPAFVDPLIKKTFQDPPGIARLTFNVTNQVLTHDHLLIGMYQERMTIGNRPDELTLLAFDRNQHRLVWGFSLPKQPMYCEINSLGLTIVYPGDPHIYLLNPKTGENIGQAPLPTMLDPLMKKIHITSSGFCYCVTQENHQCILYGGQISTIGDWRSAFRVTAPSSRCYPLENYLYFQTPDLDPSPTICSQDGSFQTLYHCSDLRIKNGKLFKVEPTSTGSLLTMQEVDASGIFQVNGTRQEFLIKASQVTLEAICDNNWVICFKTIQGRTTPCFIDISNRQTIDIACEIQPYGIHYVNPHTATLYTWDKLGRQLWAHTQQKSTQMGTIKSIASILYIDENNQIYLQ